MNSPKNALTTESHSLEGSGSLFGEKKLLLYFIPFNWFDQKFV